MHKLIMALKFFLALALYGLTMTVGLILDTTDILSFGIKGNFSINPIDLLSASYDFGGQNRVEPMAVFHPVSAEDIAKLVEVAYKSTQRFTVSARGAGHSVNGQAQTSNGIVIQMSKSINKPCRVNAKLKYVDVWGGELWIDVLKSTLRHGLAPKSWTDYLYLSVGGTLSNAGISGQAFNHGPQISNVYKLDVVTGKGELKTCSHEQNSELFHAVLGGLGQFGIITRARIALEPSPQRVRWIRLVYSNFSAFTQDQECLISLQGQSPDAKKLDYVEGFVIVDDQASSLNNWRSSISSASNISSLIGVAKGGVLYSLEIAKNYQQSNANSIDQEIEALLKRLNHIPATTFTKDLSYMDFLDRVHNSELKLRSQGLWHVPHPWLHLFVPKSRVEEFDKGVFKGILGSNSKGPILIYPMNKNKWDNRTSAVTPDDEVFYLVALLRFAHSSQALEYLSNQNGQILKFCNDNGIKFKQYLPHYATKREWIDHFGDKWSTFYRRKMEFDPKHILAPGQGIFFPKFSFNEGTF